MKKQIILSFILGGLICGSFGVLAGSYNAKQISFTPSDTTWNVKTVSEALDDIKQTDKTEIANLQSALQNKQSIIDEFSKYSHYTGSTTITPSKEEQVLSTKDKYLENDITIEKIPSMTTFLRADGFSTSYIGRGLTDVSSLKNKYTYFKLTNYTTSEAKSCNIRGYSIAEKKAIIINTNTQYLTKDYNHVYLDVLSNANGTLAYCSVNVQYYN